MVIPHLTEHYGTSSDPPEKRARASALLNPYNIYHCLTWARSEFERLFEKTPAEVSAYLLNPVEYASTMRKSLISAEARDKLERVFECLDKEKCETFQDCITWARLKFEDYFSNSVKQLIFSLPEDIIIFTGAPFWVAPRRFPCSLEFSVLDPSHLSFVLAGSILRAETFGISIPDWANNPKKLAEAVAQVSIPDFHPKQSADRADSAVIEELIEKIEQRRKFLPSGYTMMPIEFEKDDDTNYHMDFIVGLANMKARNYNIMEADKLKAKLIAGRIIPAIATPTTTATGLACLELYKVIDGGHKVEDYRNTFANLALPLISMPEPVPPKVVKHREMTWTAWDTWTFEGNPTLRELIKWVADKGVVAYSVCCDSRYLYSSMNSEYQHRLDRKLMDVARELQIPLCRRHMDLVVACEDADGNDIEIPIVAVYFC